MFIDLGLTSAVTASCKVTIITRDAMFNYCHEDGCHKKGDLQFCSADIHQSHPGNFEAVFEQISSTVFQSLQMTHSKSSSIIHPSQLHVSKNYSKTHSSCNPHFISDYTPITFSKPDAANSELHLLLD